MANLDLGAVAKIDDELMMPSYGREITYDNESLSVNSYFDA